MDRLIEDERSRKLLIRFIEEQAFPFVVTLTKGRRRSVEQNRLQFLWINEIAEQRGDVTPEEVRGESKLAFGVPIRRAEDEKFRAAYDKWVKPLPYEQKVACMMEPLDFPVTRDMTSNQKTRYLDALYKHWTEKGLVLTRPDEPAEQAA